MDQCPAWGSVDANQSDPAVKGSVGRTGRNTAPRPSFKREKRKAEAIGSINLPDASFILEVVCGGVCGSARGGIWDWYLEGLPGSCKRPRGFGRFFVLFCFSFHLE